MASAVQILAQSPCDLVVLEAEPRLGEHQTGRNSGVIHSGIYYKPGSLKARLCAEGRDAMFRFCEERGIAHERCGKVIVATSASELPMLDEIERRGIANGLLPVRCRAEEIREREPHVRCVAGLLVRATGIVRYVDVLEELAKVVGERGGEVRLSSRVTSLRREGAEFVIETPRDVLRARNIVNCAGLQSDRVARLAGANTGGLRIVPFRGEYYDLVPDRRSLCHHLIYPVPDPQFPFLGVHLTRAVGGDVEAGPNAVLSLRREGYSRTSFSARDTAELLSFRGFWRMARKHARTGIYEIARSFNKAAFVRAVGALIPEIESRDLVPGRAGVRAQAVEPSGALVDDFRIVEGDGMFHVLNAPSPAATACLAIGGSIAQGATKVFRARPVSASVPQPPAV